MTYENPSTQTTLGELIYRVARNVGAIRESNATADGTTTTLIDSTFTQPDDYWNGSALQILYDTDYRYTLHNITDYVLSTHTTTFAPAYSGNVPANARYCIIKKIYPIDIIVQAINNALASYGNVLEIIEFDRSSTGEYLVSGDIADNIRQVQSYNSNTGQWNIVYNSKFRRDDYSNFHVHAHIPSNHTKIRFYYVDKHRPLFAYSDKVNPAYNEAQIEAVVLRATANLLQYIKSKNNSIDPVLLSNIEAYEIKAERAMAEHPLRVEIPRTPRIMKVGYKPYGGN